MRGQSLVSILQRYRSEARLSRSDAHNAQNRDSQVALLQRVQETLWESFDWPHLKVERNYALEAGKFRYNVTSDFDLERLDEVLVREGGRWLRVIPDLTADFYSVTDTESGTRSWPVQRWRVADETEIEVWPIPDQNGTPATLEGYLKVRGVRRLSRFVDDDDKADLDDHLIALTAAAETLQAAGAKDAKTKADLARDRFLQLTGRLQKNRRFRMFGREDVKMRRPFISAYRPPGT